MTADESGEADISPEVEQEQIAEVRRRIASIGSGQAVLIPGDEALAQVRALVASARKAT